MRNTIIIPIKYQHKSFFCKSIYIPLGLANRFEELENDRAAYRVVAADLDPVETKAAAGAIRESMAIFIVVELFP